MLVYNFILLTVDIRGFLSTFWAVSRLSLEGFPWKFKSAISAKVLHMT